MGSNYKPQGYYRLAQVMGRSEELAIFRKFNDLNMLSLVSLQAELVKLRDDLFAIAAEDEKRGQDFDRNFAALFGSKDQANNFQYEKLAIIRDKTKEYNDRLLQAAALHQLQRPSIFNLKCLEEWLRDSKGGAARLHEDELFAWDKDMSDDLITFREDPPDQDAFTRWMTSWPVSLYHRIWGHKHKRTGGRIIDVETGLVDYHEGRLGKATKVMSTTIASTMPMVAILGLYFEESLLTRIYIAIGITAAFSALLVVFTNARRVEIFMATAGLAAVEVVFIGSVEGRLGQSGGASEMPT